MASLYSIEQELLDLFDNIEANDGEVTEEEYDSLYIKQEELKAKLESYYKAICLWESDANCCKEEKKRINDVQNKYKNRIDKLKSAMLEAVQQFGEHGKTNMFIELPTMRLSTRNSKSIKVDSHRVELLCKFFHDYIVELYNNGVIECGTDIDMLGILQAINANFTAEFPDEEPFSLADLIALRVNVKTTDTLENLLKSYPHVLNEIGNNPFTINIEDATEKDEWKRNINAARTAGARITLAEEVANVSLQIK